MARRGNSVNTMRRVAYKMVGRETKREGREEGGIGEGKGKRSGDE